MLPSPETPPAYSSPKTIDLVGRAHEKLRQLPEEIAINGDQIAASLWPKMLELTTQDTFEKGLTVAKGLFGKIHTSEIKSGTRSRVDFPFMGSFNRVVSYIHTHAPLEKINKLIPTSMFSGDDCVTFAKSDAACSVMLDEGGVHVLIKNRGMLRKSDVPKDIMDTSVNIAEQLEGKGLILDAMKAMASTLQHHGIKYYYSPSHALTEDGYLVVKEVENYKSLSKKNNATDIS